jgi:large repetitive protein
MRSSIRKVLTPVVGLGLVVAATSGGMLALGAQGASAVVVKPAVTGVVPAITDTASTQTVSITGSSFTGMTDVMLTPVSGPSIDLHAAPWVVSPTQIVATIAAPAAGVYTIIVTNSAGANTTSAPFTVVATPTVASMTPTNGPASGGSTVTIVGTGLAGATVKVGTAAAVAAVVNAGGTSLTFRSPASVTAAGTALPVVVTSASGQVTAVATWTDDPTITSMSSQVGNITGGNFVEIKGSGFTGAVAADVVLDGQVASGLKVVNDGDLWAQTGAASAGTGNAIVTMNSTDASATTAASAWTYVSIPTVTGFASSGDTVSTAIGANITINGTGFYNTVAAPLSVYFGTTKATFVSQVGSTSVTVKVPAQAVSPQIADVTVTNTIASSPISSADKFYYLPTAAPTISSVVGSVSAASGGAVLITGTNFTGSVCGDVTAGPSGALVAVQSCTVVNDTQILVFIVPASGTTGDVWNVSVGNTRSTHNTPAVVVGAFTLG